MTGRAKKSRNSMPARRWCELIVLVAGCFAFGYFLSSCSKPENKTEVNSAEQPPANTSEFSPAPVINPNADFSKFQHSNTEHARFPCALCHERTDNSATPKLPAHERCAGCHTQQFADNKSAICTICHTNVETGAVESFPALQSFNAVFDHATHTRQTNCATCHKSIRNGVALSIPSGLNAHNSCFGCHTSEAKSGEKEIGSCNTCHQAGKPGGRSPEWVRAYSATPFSHANHRLGCASCHNIRAGAARGNQVTAPVAKMHFPPKNTQNCASCHNNKRAFGGDDFQDCRRCHKGGGFGFS